MPPRKTHQKLPTQWEERERLRNKGQFWTPDWVAKAMVSYAMQSESTLLFDPATGNGAFLEALESIRTTRKGIRFYGTDIDASLLTQEIYKKAFCHVEKRDFIFDPPPNTFSSIVANPPYIRHHRLSRETKRALREISLRNLGLPLDGRAGIHVYFLVQALSMLAPEGRLSFIMPADTCEGIFAERLWKWITKSFCLEAVVTFEPDATPFPHVDTNALVFMIKNTPPKKNLHWIRCREAHTPDLLDLVQSKFHKRAFGTLEVMERDLAEALETGLSRSPNNVQSQFKLSDFAYVMRGIATGANEFFWLTAEQARQIGIPEDMLKTAVGRTRDVPGDSITKEDIRQLDRSGRPTLLFSPDGRSLDEFPASVEQYLRKGEKLGINCRALVKTRKPWYKMEQREIPPFLFAYLGRRRARFIRNEAGVIPLTGFLCVYPHSQFRHKTEEMWKILNAQETIDNLRLVGKSYGAGAIKVEPRNLEKLPIPDGIVSRLGCYPRKIDRKGNLLLFESGASYKAVQKKRATTPSSRRRRPRG